MRPDELLDRLRTVVQQLEGRGADPFAARLAVGQRFAPLLKAAQLSLFASPTGSGGATQVVQVKEHTRVTPHGVEVVHAHAEHRPQAAVQPATNPQAAGHKARLERRARRMEFERKEHAWHQAIAGSLDSSLDEPTRLEHVRREAELWGWISAQVGNATGVLQRLQAFRQLDKRPVRTSPAATVDAPAAFVPWTVDFETRLLQNKGVQLGARVGPDTWLGENSATRTHYLVHADGRLSVPAKDEYAVARQARGHDPRAGSAHLDKTEVSAALKAAGIKVKAAGLMVASLGDGRRYAVRFEDVPWEDRDDVVKTESRDRTLLQVADALERVGLRVTMGAALDGMHVDRPVLKSQANAHLSTPNEDLARAVMPGQLTDKLFVGFRTGWADVRDGATRDVGTGGDFGSGYRQGSAAARRVLSGDAAMLAHLDQHMPTVAQRVRSALAVVPTAKATQQALVTSPHRGPALHAPVDSGTARCGRTVLAPSKTGRGRRWQCTDHQGKIVHKPEHQELLNRMHRVGGHYPMMRATAERKHVQDLVSQGLVELHQNPVHHAHEFTARLTAAGHRTVDRARSVREADNSRRQGGLFGGLTKGVAASLLHALARAAARPEALVKAALVEGLAKASPEDILDEDTWEQDGFTCTMRQIPGGIRYLTLTHPRLPLPYHQMIRDNTSPRAMAAQAIPTLLAGRAPPEGVFRRVGRLPMNGLGRSIAGAAR